MPDQGTAAPGLSPAHAYQPEPAHAYQPEPMPLPVGDPIKPPSHRRAWLLAGGVLVTAIAVALTSLWLLRREVTVPKDQRLTAPPATATVPSPAEKPTYGTKATMPPPPYKRIAQQPVVATLAGGFTLVAGEPELYSSASSVTYRRGTGAETLSVMVLPQPAGEDGTDLVRSSSWSINHGAVICAEGSNDRRVCGFPTSDGGLVQVQGGALTFERLLQATQDLHQRLPS